MKALISETKKKKERIDAFIEPHEKTFMWRLVYHVRVNSDSHGASISDLLSEAIGLLYKRYEKELPTKMKEDYETGKLNTEKPDIQKARASNTKRNT